MPSKLTDEPATDPNFPEIVLRGANRLNLGLKRYFGRLPRQMSHYGGFYTMTKENWPLVGPMKTKARLRCGRSFRLRDHGRVCRRRALRRLGARRAASRLRLATEP